MSFSKPRQPLIPYEAISPLECLVSYGDLGELREIKFEAACPPSRVIRKLYHHTAIKVAAVVIATILPLLAMEIHFSDQILPFTHMRWMAAVLNVCVFCIGFVAWQFEVNQRSDVLFLARKQFCSLAFEISTVQLISDGPYGSLDISFDKRDIIDVRVNSGLSGTEAPEIQKTFAGRWLEIHLKGGDRLQILPEREQSDYLFVRNALLKSRGFNGTGNGYAAI